MQVLMLAGPYNCLRHRHLGLPGESEGRSKVRGANAWLKEAAGVLRWWSEESDEGDCHSATNPRLPATTKLQLVTDAS